MPIDRAVDEKGGEAPPVLVVEALQQRLHDPQSGEEFWVTVEDRLAIYAGTFAAILGPSGCGKTTLLSVLGLLRRPTDPKSIGCFEIAGYGRRGKTIVYDVKELWRRNRQRRIERLRRQNIGFALQSGELLHSLRVWENIAVPLRLNGIGGRRCSLRVHQLLGSFGLSPDDHAPADESLGDGASEEAKAGSDRGMSVGRLANARVNKLSGGEYQRVVLARAIAHRPRLVFVDEPTSSLNRELARASLSQLKASQFGVDDPGAIVMITHDEQLASEFADVVIRMAPEKDRAAGRVVEIVDQNPTAEEPTNGRHTVQEGVS